MQHEKKKQSRQRGTDGEGRGSVVAPALVKGSIRAVAAVMSWFTSDGVF